MNEVLKPRLHLFLLVGLRKPLLLSRFSPPRAGNGRRDFTGLVDMHGQGSSDNDHLNGLKDESPRRRDKLNTRSGNIRAGIPRQETAAAASI